MYLGLGNKLSAMWQGFDMQNVYDSWADDLQEFSIGAIAYASEQCARAEFAPSLGEFRKRCLEYKPDSLNVLKITSKMSEEQKAANKARLNALVRQYCQKAEM